MEGKSACDRQTRVVNIKMKKFCTRLDGAFKIQYVFQFSGHTERLNYNGLSVKLKQVSVGKSYITFVIH